MSKDSYFNSEGYRDPTAYEAIKNITDEADRVTALIHVIKTILRICGFELIRRIEIRSTKTGREYK